MSMASQNVAELLLLLLHLTWNCCWFYNICFCYMKRSALNCRVKLWLFISYVVSFVSLAGAVGFLVQDALTDSGPSAWTGTAGILQCVFVLVRSLFIPYCPFMICISLDPYSTAYNIVCVSCSGLIYWTCHSDDWLEKYDWEIWGF
jgi:hypothetical protein